MPAPVLDFVLDAISGRPIAYLIVAGIVLVDDFVPFAPGNTAMIIAGILAANDSLVIVLVIAAGTAGEFFGDNAFYLFGGGLRRWSCAAGSASRRQGP
jgi:membrane protein DedA with SNARE-associated domain